MVTYLDILNRARARQGSSPLSVTSATGASGDALIGVQALNEALSDFYSNSFDIDVSERAQDVLTVSGK